MDNLPFIIKQSSIMLHRLNYLPLAFYQYFCSPELLNPKSGFDGKFYSCSSLVAQPYARFHEIRDIILYCALIFLTDCLVIKVYKLCCT